MLWWFSPLALGRRKGTFHCSLKAPADWLSLKKPGHFLGILWSPFPLAHAAQTSPHWVFCTCPSNLFPWQWSLRHSVPSLLPVTHRPVPWWSCCSASAPSPTTHTWYSLLPWLSWSSFSDFYFPVRKLVSHVCVWIDSPLVSHTFGLISHFGPCILVNPHIQSPTVAK